jgi:hypothetical protein
MRPAWSLNRIPLAVQADGRDVVTVEGIGFEGELPPMQEAFHSEHALQCGYGTPGMITADWICCGRTSDPLEEHRPPGEGPRSTRGRSFVTETPVVGRARLRTEDARWSPGRRTGRPPR